MGFIKNTIFILAPTISYAGYITYWLGPELPRIARKFGNYLGLFYRVFKIGIQSSKPNLESGEIMHYLKKSDYQSMTFARETTRQYLEIKQEIKRLTPEEIQVNPFQKFKLKPDAPIKIDGGLLDGSSILKNIHDESLRLKRKNNQTKDR